MAISHPYHFPPRHMKHEGGGGVAALVAQQLDINQLRCVIDCDKHEVPARAKVVAPHPRSGDAVAGSAEPTELLDVRIDQISRSRALVMPHGFRRVHGARRPIHARASHLRTMCRETPKAVAISAALVARLNAGHDLLSTISSKASTLMQVVHPSGSSAGVWQLQPNPASGEQTPETLQQTENREAEPSVAITRRLTYLPPTFANRKYGNLTSSSPNRSRACSSVRANATIMS